MHWRFLYIHVLYIGYIWDLLAHMLRFAGICWHTWLHPQQDPLTKPALFMNKLYIKFGVMDYLILHVVAPPSYLEASM